MEVVIFFLACTAHLDFKKSTLKFTKNDDDDDYDDHDHDDDNDDGDDDGDCDCDDDDDSDDYNEGFDEDDNKAISTSP